MSAIAISGAGTGAGNPSFLSAPRREGLTRRGRLARFLVVLSLSVVVVAGFASRAGAGDQVGGARAATYVAVVVAPGDTVWSIAGAMADGRDVRGLVDEIVAVNGLRGASVEAGQSIRVPVK